MSANEYSHGNKSKKETIEFNRDGFVTRRFLKMKDKCAIDWQEKEKQLWSFVINIEKMMVVMIVLLG